jgi:acetyl esterase/lipase
MLHSLNRFRTSLLWPFVALLLAVEGQTQVSRFLFAQEPPALAGQSADVKILPDATEGQPTPVSVPRSKLQVQKDLVFHEVADEEVAADFYRPAGDRVLPLVVMIHGGGWISGDKWNVIDHAKELARNGMAVLAINYRLAPDHRYPAQLEDCRKALAWAAQRADEWSVDCQRVGLWGYSAGGQLASMLATDAPETHPVKIRCLVAGGAPNDLTYIPEQSKVLAMVFGGSRKELPEVYQNASPIFRLNAQCPPAMLFHGTKDLLVPYDTSVRFQERAKEVGVECQLIPIEGQGHLVTFLHPKGRSSAIEFLSKYLKAEPLP